MKLGSLILFLILSVSNLKAQEYECSIDRIEEINEDAFDIGGMSKFLDVLIDNNIYGCVSSYLENSENIAATRFYFLFHINSLGKLERVQFCDRNKFREIECLDLQLETMQTWNPAKNSKGESVSQQLLIPLTICFK